MNYFSHTAAYRIWMDVISILTPKTSFLVKDFNLGFDKLVCTREEVKNIHSDNNRRVEMICNYADRYFFCLLIDAKTNEKITWCKTNPEFRRANNFTELEEQIDEWLEFLKSEL